MMPEALRRTLIVDSLIGAVQANKISNREKETVLWLLRNNRGRLDRNALMLTELRSRVIAACPLLEEESEAAPAASEAEALACSHPNEVQLCSDEGMKDSSNEPPNNSYGLSPVATHQGD